MHPLYQLTVGKDYLVLGLSFLVNSAIYGSSSLLEVCDDAGRCISIPTMLFEVVDPRPSRFWLAKRVGETDFIFWPEEFYQEYFHDRLSDRQPEAVATFSDVLNRLDAEFGRVGEVTLC
jgi:hypothetical protein